MSTADLWCDKLHLDVGCGTGLVAQFYTDNAINSAQNHVINEKSAKSLIQKSISKMNIMVHK